MPLPSAGALSTDMIADEVGYTMSFLHNLSGPLGGGGNATAPGTFSLHYFFRPGNVATTGVQQIAPFSMSAFYGQEAIYRCVSFTASGAATGSANIVSYYKTSQTVILTSNLSQYCVRQNWDGQLAISNTQNATWSAGPTCGAIQGQSVPAQNSAYSKFGIRVFNLNGWDSQGLPNTTGATLAAYNTVQVGGTFSNLWWSNPNQNTVDGRLNRTGLWNAANVPTPGQAAINYGGWGFFSVSFNLTQSRVYYIGLAGDNGISVEVNGLTAYKQTNYGSSVTFDWWNIIPVTFSSGSNIVRLANFNQAGSVGSFGIDIYSNTQSDLLNILNGASPGATAQPSGLQLLYTTADFRDRGTFFQNLDVLCPETPGNTTTTTTTTTTSTTTTTTTILDNSTIYTIYKSNSSTQMSVFYRVNGGSWNECYTNGCAGGLTQSYLNYLLPIGGKITNLSPSWPVGAYIEVGVSKCVVFPGGQNIQFGVGNGSGNFTTYCGTASPYGFTRSALQDIYLNIDVSSNQLVACTPSITTTTTTTTSTTTTTTTAAPMTIEVQNNKGSNINFFTVSMNGINVNSLTNITLLTSPNTAGTTTNAVVGTNSMIVTNASSNLMNITAGNITERTTGNAVTYSVAGNGTSTLTVSLTLVSQNLTNGIKVIIT